MGDQFQIFIWGLVRIAKNLRFVKILNTLGGYLSTKA